MTRRKDSEKDAHERTVSFNGRVLKAGWGSWGPGLPSSGRRIHPKPSMDSGYKKRGK